MSTKSEITEKLTAAGIDHDPEATKATLEALLPDEGTSSGEGNPQEIAGITVRDPLILRPRELPLVIPTPEGGWANEAQAEYARYLNGYAYKNPEKWAKKMADRAHTDGQGRSTTIKGLVAKLAALAKNPELLTVYNGEGTEGASVGKLAYTDKRIQG